MKEKKLLIAVQCGGGDIVMKIKEGADATWNSQEYSNTKTLFTKGGEKEEIIDNVYYSGSTDEYDYCHVVFRNFLRYVWNWDWDYILHGSISSYFDKEQAYKKMLTLPEEKCYCGNLIEYYDHGYASGACFFISRDVAKILMDQLPETPVCEDVIFGIILNQNGIRVTPGSERVELNNLIKGGYHYRCKEILPKEVDPNHRLNVIENFHKVHKFIKGE